MCNLINKNSLTRYYLFFTYMIYGIGKYRYQYCSKRKFLSYAPYIFSTHEDRIQLIFAIFLFLLAIINITPFTPSPMCERMRVRSHLEGETTRESRATVSANKEQITAIASVSWQRHRCNSFFALSISTLSFLQMWKVLLLRTA